MEIWKTINAEPNYEVSNTGKVRRKDSLHIKSLRFDRYGYLRVTLYPSGKTYTIHRLVAKAFLDNFENKPQVNHKNGIKTDNKVSNLEWCTNKDNIIHAYDNNLITSCKGEKNAMAKLTDSQVIEIRNNPKYKDLNYKEIAKIFNIAHETARRICLNKTWKHLV